MELNELNELDGYLKQIHYKISNVSLSARTARVHIS